MAFYFANGEKRGQDRDKSDDAENNSQNTDTREQMIILL